MPYYSMPKGYKKGRKALKINEKGSLLGAAFSASYGGYLFACSKRLLISSQLTVFHQAAR